MPRRGRPACPTRGTYCPIRMTDWSVSEVDNQRASPGSSSASSIASRSAVHLAAERAHQLAHPLELAPQRAVVVAVLHQLLLAEQPKASSRRPLLHGRAEHEAAEGLGEIEGERSEPAAARPRARTRGPRAGAAPTSERGLAASPS